MNKFFVLMLSAVVIIVMTIPVSSEAGGRRHRRNPDIGDVAVGLGIMAAATFAAVAIGQAFNDRPYHRGYYRDYDHRYDRGRLQRHVRQNTKVVVVVPPGGHVRVDGGYRWQYQR